jgi:hypothetical protein
MALVAVQYKTAMLNSAAYTRAMQQTYVRTAAASTWVLATLAAGWAAGANSVTGWGMIGLLAAGPSVYLLRWRNEPEQTMSAAIQEARR